MEAEGPQQAPPPPTMVGNGDCKTLWVGDIQVSVKTSLLCLLAQLDTQRR